MSKLLLGAQMYTARDFCKTPADIAASCAKVKKMGYDGIENSGFGPIDPKELKKILDGEGLQCAATHIGLDSMRNETQRVIDEHKLWGCKYPAIGGCGLPAQEFAPIYTELAKTFGKHGMQIGYHNHSQEFAWINGKGGETIMDYLVKNLGKGVWFEVDVYWVQHGGADPAAFIDRVAGRIPCVHYKDMSIKMVPNAAGKKERVQFMTEIGSGNLNWKRIHESILKAGTEWVLVERDAGDLDPFESLKVSHDYIRGTLKV